MPFALAMSGKQLGDLMHLAKGKERQVGLKQHISKYGF